MKEYIIVKTVTNNIIEYDGIFDNEHDAIEQATKLNQRAKEDGWDGLVHFAVLPCIVTSKVASK